MPEAFNNCVSSGGKVYTMTGPSERFNLGSGEYRHICSKTGKDGKVHTYWGEKKTKKSK